MISVFDSFSKGMKVQITYYNIYDEVEEVSGRVTEVNKTRRILTIADTEGNTHNFYDWEVKEIKHREKVVN